MLAQGADCEPLPVAMVLSLLGMASGLPGAQPWGAGEQDRRGWCQGSAPQAGFCPTEAHLLKFSCLKTRPKGINSVKILQYKYIVF